MWYVGLTETTRLGELIQLVELPREKSLVELCIRTEIVAVNYEVFPAVIDHDVKAEQHQVEFRTKCLNELVHMLGVETRLLALFHLLFVIRRTKCDLTVELKAPVAIHRNKTFWDGWTDDCAVPVGTNRVHFVYLLEVTDGVLLNKDLLVVEAAEI